MKTALITVGVAAVLLIGGSLWSNSLANSNPDIVSRTGIHWHPHLTIMVGTTTVPIPEGIGLGSQFAGTPSYDQQMQMAAIHTHDASGTIHMEFDGVVHKDDLTLGQFFKVWGKDMRSFGTNMRMTVNGVPNTDYEDYVMHDGDKIVLQFN